MEVHFFLFLALWCRIYLEVYYIRHQSSDVKDDEEKPKYIIYDPSLVEMKFRNGGNYLGQ